MSAAANLPVVRKLYEAFAKRDGGTIRALLAPDCAWHVPGRSGLAGVHRGPDGVLAYFGKLSELSDGTFHAEVRDLGASDTHVYVSARARGQRLGRSYDATYLLALRVEHGRIAEARLYNEDQHAFDAFWA
ncbi:MAG: nuclear transport factor 2 family protein [Halobacteriales archaeon]|nr:nuclear transport factor 2 family protein [Halobacteriales archaeon]